MDYSVWDVDPVLLNIGLITVSWYGLLFFGSFIVGAIVIREWIFKREGFSQDILHDLFLYSIVGTLIGSRLMHCLAYEPDYFLSNPLEILKIWKGGLASHGGMLGALVALWLVAKKYKLSYLWLISRMTMPGFLVAFSVRLGNFFNSEIVGRVTDVPWAVIFARVDTLPRHPVQLYEAFSYLILFMLFVILYRNISQTFATRLLTGLFLLSMFVIRFLLEYTKTNQASYTWDLPLSTGQMLSLPFILIGMVWTIWEVKTKDNARL